jgi:hypothetical protein
MSRIVLLPDNPLRHRRWQAAGLAVLFWLVVLLLTGCRADTFEGWAEIEGAIICTAVGTFVLAAALIVLRWAIDSYWWRRQCRAAGGEASAKSNLRFDEKLQRGMTCARRRGWLPEDVQ